VPTPSSPVIGALSVVLPAYNEGPTIERVVRECLAYLERRVPDHELIVVNDGSQDRTGEILDRLARELARLRPHHHSANLGYGSALRTGFAAATKDFVFYMDSDGQFDICDLDAVLPLATDDTHIVTGYRLERHDPFIRRLNARLFSRLVRIMLGVRVVDLNCAFKLLPKKILDRITLESSGALIDTELHARSIRRGFGIKEVGVRHYPRAAGVQTGAYL